MASSKLEQQQQLGLVLLVLILVALVSSSTVDAALPSSTELNTCDISEFRCPSKDGQGSLCLPMDRWCNGKDDCDNRVDEPRSCSICNRTYYARLGYVYRLSLVRPRLTGTSQILPWHCWFNFTALGGHHGDRVLVGMESFSVGQLHRSDNGSMCLGGQVVQRDEASMGNSNGGGGELVDDGDGGAAATGAWCGEGWGQPITTSSGKWLQLLLTISDVVDLSRFRFDLTYRVVRSDSTLFSLPFSTSQSSPTPGYGGNNGAIGAIGIGVAQHISGMGNVDMSSGGIAVDNNIIVSYGDPVPGTLCSHNLHSCDQRTCIIQSPNFPGLYPRNVTCYYYIRQSWAPRNQTVLISVGQAESGRSISVRTSDAGEKERKMKNGPKDCRTTTGDTLSIYNGATVESPLLARLCGAGLMPDITGTGPEMLVVLHSQPHDSPFNPALLGATPGFRLKVGVRFVPGQLSFAQHHKCRLSVISAGSSSRRSQRQGIVRSPEVTLAANTSCRYEFIGREDQRVWITFLAYRLENGQADDCLTLVDGQEVVSRQCGSQVQPKLCPRALVHGNATGVRPCRWQDDESYLSHSNSFTVRQELGAGTALNQWSFVLRYEFITVDKFRPDMPGSEDQGQYRDDQKQLQKEDLHHPKQLEDARPACYQMLDSSKGNGSIFSPRNPLLYGRGGSRHLRCLYRFQAAKGEQTHLTINPFQTAGCARFNQSGCQSCLSVDEIFWDNSCVRRRSYHTCRSLPSNTPVVLQSAASAVELIFEVRDMNWSQDDDHFYFVAEYSFSGGIDPTCWNTHRQLGKRGTMRIDRRDRCVRHSIPWHLQAPRGGYIVLVFPVGRAVVTKNAEECLTDNRLFIYSIVDGKTQLYRQICLLAGDQHNNQLQPQLQQPLYVYSSGWAERHWLAEGVLVVASLQGPVDEAPFDVNWLSVFRDTPRLTTPPSSKDFQSARQQQQTLFGNNNMYNNNNNVSIQQALSCRAGCAPLGVCLNAELWCDDHEDCPDGSDERQCIRLVFWPLYVGLAVILTSLTVSVVAVYLIHRYYQAKHYSVPNHNQRKFKPDKKAVKFSSSSSLTVCSRHYEKAGPGS